MIELLDLDDIARLYRVTRRHARDYTVKQAGFPPPVAGSGTRVPLWLADEIKAYMRRKPAQITHKRLEAA